ncbi:MAG: GNAT family N-acetyltransferase, partial [Mesotoga sp.]|nr:GNAT family N-acetyltransferase [Mesotoga sp.]
FDWDDIRSARRTVRKIHRCAWEEGITLINFSRDRSLGSMKDALGLLSFRIPFEIMIYEKNGINRGSRPIIRTPTI